jgi:hypothetical protein
MSIAVFVILFLVSAGIVVYPLLSPQKPSRLSPAVSEADIDRALRKMRSNRPKAGLTCPQCGQAYQAGDQFCVQCGQALPDKPVARGPVCPACGVSVHEGDLFCAKCGAQISEGEAV